MKKAFRARRKEEKRRKTIMTKYCIIRTETNTLAQKGKKLLGTHGIRAETARTEAAGGCASGLRLPCESIGEAREILLRGGIPVLTDEKTEREKR